MKNKIIKNKEVKNAGKKGILFSILTFILLFSLFSFAGLWSLLMSEKQSRVSLSNTQMSYFEDDVITNAFADITMLRITNITRGTSVTISFDQLLMNSSFRSYDLAMQDYRNFIQNNYSLMNNINASLSGFNESLTIKPYNSTAVIGTQSTYFYTMPSAANYVQSVSVVIRTSQERKSACKWPNNDPGFTPVTVMFIDPSGFSCSNTFDLNPAENNDKAGKQFYFDSADGNTEVKYGLINGQNGVLQIIQNSLPINVTSLQISYTPLNEKVVIYNGQLNTNSKLGSAAGSVKKNTDIVYAQE